MEEAVIVSAVRSAVGKARAGTLRGTRPDDLAAAVIAEALRRAPGLDPSDVEDVILGCAMPEAEQGLNLARNCVFLADFPSTAAGMTINRFCSSGLQAIVLGGLSIQAGLEQVVVAGGVESMSMVPMSGNKVSLSPELMERYPEAYIAMGHTAERVAKRFEVSRTHPKLDRVLSLLTQVRTLTDEVWDEVFEHNSSTPLPDDERLNVTFYFGQNIDDPTFTPPPKQS